MTKTTAVKNPETGQYEEVETEHATARIASNGLEALAGFADIEAAGFAPSKTAWSDTFTFGPFTFRIREVGRPVRLADDAFVQTAVEELGLEQIVASLHDYSTFDEPEKAIRMAAQTLFATEAFRSDYPELSTRADELLAEKYDTVILGLEEDSSDPTQWGGLVGWTIKDVSPDKFPFTPENVRRLKPKTKLALYERILALSRAGIDDAHFRRANR